MYWTSTLVGQAVALELVPTRPLARLARRVRRRAGDQPAHDILWAEELVHAGLLSLYQARTLLEAAPQVERRSSRFSESPLKIGTFVIHDRIGRSDLGSTFLGMRSGESEPIAIKRLSARWTSDDRLRSKWISGIERWMKLADQRIMPVAPMEFDDGGLALTSTFLPSGSLAQLLRVGRPIPSAHALGIVYELIAVLARADAHGLTFGDLRPSNILLDRRGRLRLVDCGLRCTIPDAGLRIDRNLPPHRYDYVAPEVSEGLVAPDAAADIYSIGCLLYHMVTGRPPYFGGNAERKAAMHRAGQVVEPRLLGIETTAEVKHILQGTLQAERSRRIGSYNDLLSYLSPGVCKSRRRMFTHLRVGFRTGPKALWTSTGPRRRSRLLVTTAIAAALVLSILHGSTRLLPLLRLKPLQETNVLINRETNEAKKTTAEDRARVTALWNASEDLRAAFRDAAPNDTVTLQSPGPFLLDAIAINKPITLRGADSVRPLFIGGPGTSLRITASDVHLENIHFVRVGEPLHGQGSGDSAGMIEALGQRLVVAKCSFQDVSGESTAGVRWKPSDDGTDRPAMRQVLFRNLHAAITAPDSANVQIELQNCMHLGYGPLVRSTSGRSSPFESVDVTIMRTTVFGAGTCEHSFPHPLDGVAPLRISAKESLLIPHNREQPILSVQYAMQPPTLMPKVSWSGSNTICPADATVLEVQRSSDASVWRASDVAAWQKYWGTHTTGMIGARIDFPGSPPGVPSDIPAPRLADQSTVGADTEQIWYPPPITLDQLPLLLQRLEPQR
jgi:hypothetical protein